MDPECAICDALLQATTNLSRISDFILMSQPKKKKDFGLYESLVKRHIGEIAKMQKYHEYYHATGESLSDMGSGIDYSSGGGDYTPPKPQRFRKYPSS